MWSKIIQTCFTLLLHLPPMTPNRQCLYFVKNVKDGKMSKYQYISLHYYKGKH